MGLKFVSNLSFMFLEGPSLIERYQLAKDAGFKAVESGFPLGFSPEEVANAKNKANIEQILINVFTGDTSKGELGFAAIPGQEESFKKSIETTIQYAKALNCKLIHVMSGKVNNPTVDNDKVYEKNLLYAVEKFKEEGLIGVIEPINSITVPNYYMNNFSKGLNIVKKINSPHLRLQLDIFHMQHCCGNLTRNIEELLPFIGHIQIAQVPHRHEPDTTGEIDYKYILSLLENKGYQGYIGLEYVPKANTVDGLKWITKFGYSL
ncbi:hypothetical protein HZH68_005830 [Vespula germanica]|uniref:Putative hydroxypyruvate isomerase n=1 Tax=Vespula germanica TaxID=30212 RepID=A0A834KGS3_VESGE|nr:hypothetical protein HZH68_005830 [Vespula germanica]